MGHQVGHTRKEDSMNKRQMERLELLFSEGKTLEEAREHFPDSWKMPREADFQANITAALQ